MLDRLIRRRAAARRRALLIVPARVAAVVAFGGRPTSSSTTAARSTATRRAFTAWEGDRQVARAARGTAPELFERLRSEGSDTPADLLVTTDLANLWRAKEAGMLQPVDTPALERRCRAVARPRRRVVGPEPAHPHADALDRARPTDAIRAYEDLGDPRWKGKLCLRTSNNEYNQSFVADRIAKHGAARRESCCASWMANEPQILGSDVDVLDAIAAGRCDVGLTNHYYLGRKLKDDPTSRSRPPGPTRTAPARTRTSPASGS
jgi:iron(III) transport system substrate-binding protein